MFAKSEPLLAIRMSSDVEYGVPFMSQRLNPVVTPRETELLNQKSPTPRRSEGGVVRWPVAQKIGSKIQTAPPAVPAGNSTT